MPSLNKVQLIGNLGRDPEVRFTPDTQERVVSFSMAVNRRKRNENGRQTQETDWFTIEAWGRVAEPHQRMLRIETVQRAASHKHTSRTEQFVLAENGQQFAELHL